MRVGFYLDAEHFIECQWANFTGRERYLLNGKEILSLRSFRPTGQRQLDIKSGDRHRQVVIDVQYKPSLKSLTRSNGIIAPVRVDGELIVEDLLDKQYRLKSPLQRILQTVAGFTLGAMLLLGVDAYVFDGALLDLPRAPLPESIEIANAATATPECRASLDDYDQSLLVPMKIAIQLREREMARTGDWLLDNDKTPLSVLAEVHWSMSPQCRPAIHQLLERYISNGADIDQRFGYFNMPVLQATIMGGDALLTCVLLEQSASLNVKVTTTRGNGTNAPITGLTLHELAIHNVKQRGNRDDTRVLDTIEAFLDEGQCRQTNMVSNPN